MASEIGEGSTGLLHDFLLQGLPAAQAGLAAAREARASGAGPDHESLRYAYLDLLKLALCDLVGTTTASVGAMPGGEVASQELHGERLRLRSAGLDWPLQGLTMIGLGRLDDLQSCVESVVRDGVAGDLIEAGAWRGGASIMMRATLDSLGDRNRTVWVADSFEGFPSAEDEPADVVDLSAYDFLAAPLDEVRDNFARLGYERGVRFVPGLFEQTLPGLSEASWALIRLDADTYEATRTALGCLYPRLAIGGYLIVDDYGAFEGCRRAVDEFRREHAVAEPLEQVDYPCVRWRRDSATHIEVPPAPVAAAAADGAPRAGAARDRRVPTIRERELARELAELRAVLSSPRRAPAAWLRRKLRGAARSSSP